MALRRGFMQQLEPRFDTQRPIVFVVAQDGHQLVGTVLGRVPSLDVTVADATSNQSPSC